jgi:hypothetical protein
MGLTSGGDLASVSDGHQRKFRFFTGLWDHLRAAVFLCILLVLGGPSLFANAATSTTIEGVTLDLPDASNGWTRPDEFVLRKVIGADETAGRREPLTALIQLFKPLPKGVGTFEANFARAVGQIPELARENAWTRSQGVTINGHAIIIEQRCCGRLGKVSISGIHVGIEGPQSQLFLAFVLLGDLEDDKQNLKAEFEAMVRSIRLAPSDIAFHLMPPKGSGGLDSVCAYVKASARPSAFGEVNIVAEAQLMLFDPAGIFSRALPAGGSNIEAHCQANPTDCGTYRLLGGGILNSPSQIEITEVTDGFGVLQRETENFARSGADLRIGKRNCRHVPPMPKGVKLEGVWEHVYGDSGRTGASSGSVAVVHTLTLTRDGNFTREASSSLSMTSERGASGSSVAVSGKRRAERGQYDVDGYGLTLAAEDGSKQRLSVFRPDGKSDELLVIDGATYRKRSGTKDAD